MQATHQRTHKVPTHMSLPDKVVFGLTARQLLLLLIGCSLGYNLWLHLGVLGGFGAPWAGTTHCLGPGASRSGRCPGLDLGRRSTAGGLVARARALLATTQDLSLAQPASECATATHTVSVIMHLNP